MKTKLTALILAILMLLSLASCGEKENNETDDSQKLNITEKPTYDYDLSEYITLPDHSAIEVSCRLIHPAESDIDALIEEEMYAAGTASDVTFRAAQEGDRITYDSVGTRKSDNVVFEQGSARTAIIGGLSYLPGFTENFIGSNAGDIVTFDYTYPVDYYEESLAGAEVTYKMTVTKVEDLTPVEFTDSYVQFLKIEGVTTTEQYRDYLFKQNEEVAELENEQTVRDAIYAAIAEGSTLVKMPEAEYDYYYEICEKTNRTYARTAGISVEDYVIQNYGSQEAYEEYAKSYSESHVIEDLIMWSLVREYGITVDEEEYREQLQYGYENYGPSYGAADIEQFEELVGQDLSEGMLLRDALDAVAETAIVTEK